MAVQALNAPPPSSGGPAVPGARGAQPSTQEVQKPREGDQINVSKAAVDRAKLEATRLGELRTAERSQQAAAGQVQKGSTNPPTALQSPGRVDFTV